jgi:hypothetical protein
MLVDVSRISMTESVRQANFAFRKEPFPEL